MIYDTDTAHCEGTECAIRDKCRRYQLHLMRENIKVLECYLKLIHYASVQEWTM